MSSLFLTVLKMSLTASYVIFLVLLVRVLLRKAPKVISYALWSVVAFRLIIPFSFESSLSLLPAVSTGSIHVSPTFTEEQNALIEAKMEASQGVSYEDVNKPAPIAHIENSTSPLQVYTELGAYIWILGVILLLGYSVTSVFRFKRKLKGAYLIQKNIYSAEHLKTPFVLGLIKPRIYLPAGLGQEESHYILLHEQIHIQRKDYIVKIIAFIIVAVHWFNPFVWLAFKLMSLDMEYACDEKVLKALAPSIKKTYASSLLTLAAQKQIINGSPLAFGEGDVKGRIKNVLKYKKPKFWVVTVATILTLSVSIMLISNPTKEEPVGRAQTEVEIPEVASSNTETVASLVEEDIQHLEPEEKPIASRYDVVKMTLLSRRVGELVEQVVLSEANVVTYIDTMLFNSKIPALATELVNNNTNIYAIELSNAIGGYGCKLYYDTLYDKAYLEDKGGLVEVDLDFARYIASFFQNSDYTLEIEDKEAKALFESYGWTLDYKINTVQDSLSTLDTLGEFEANSYYYAYNNELSKDIGLDISSASGREVSVDIYRLHQSMPQAFYPIREARGIVVKNNNHIIGAFISAGRHSAFNACSLKGKSFEEVTDQTLYQWFEQKLKVDSLEKQLAKLEPQQMIETYFTALANKDAKTAVACLSKASLLEGLTTNMDNKALYNPRIVLPLTASDDEGESYFGNLKSAELVAIEPIEVSDKTPQSIKVTVKLAYKKEIVLRSGEHVWFCQMVYESPQTGWKIEGFGH